jgi:hypothetical protein
VRGTLDWGVLDEKRTLPNTKFERPKWDFGPTSVILCPNSVGAVDYVETEAWVEVKLLSVPKRTQAKAINKRRFSIQRRELHLRVSAPWQPSRYRLLSVSVVEKHNTDKCAAQKPTTLISVLRRNKPSTDWNQSIYRDVVQERWIGERFPGWTKL